MDTNASKSIIIKEGYYLLKDAPIPCDGRIASIELCGVSISSDLTQVYLNASIYRPHLTNSLERITELVRLESGSSNILVINDGVTCARLSAVDYNWTVLKGDILGVSFVNSSCDPEERTFGTLQTCPVYAAIQTNSTSDMVYSSENNSLTTIQFDKLSNITGVKINLQVFVGECSRLIIL